VLAGRRHQDVAGCDIAMDDQILMGKLDGRTDFEEQIED
jgi:hypothetical protein